MRNCGFAFQYAGFQLGSNTQRMQEINEPLIEPGKKSKREREKQRRETSPQSFQITTR